MSTLSFFLVACLLAPAPSHGDAEVGLCDCNSLSTSEAFERATLVFTGRVVRGEFSTDETERLIGYGGVRYWLDVEEVFKGDVQDMVEVRGGPGGMCFYNFSVSLRYVVFTHRARSQGGDVQLVSMCLPTAQLDQSEETETLRHLRSRRP